MIDRLIWVDLETTGFDPAVDLVLEVAVTVTDGDLVELGAGEWVIGHPSGVYFSGDGGINYPPHMNPDAVILHAANGLLREVARSATTLADVEVEILRLLVDHQVGVREAPLCGASVHFDRAFLARHLPLLDRWAHYRHVDISTLGTLTGLWWPEAYPDTPDSPHRAGPDVAASIEGLRRYRRLLWPTRWPE